MLAENPSMVATALTASPGGVTHGGVHCGSRLHLVFLQSSIVVGAGAASSH